MQVLGLLAWTWSSRPLYGSPAAMEIVMGCGNGGTLASGLGLGQLQSEEKMKTTDESEIGSVNCFAK